MCGIYGRIGIRDDDLDRRATRTLRARGPDDAGLVLDPEGLNGRCVALGHTRLSIIAPGPAGHQPMVTADAATVLVFGGEIANFRTLRAELERDGVRFAGPSDTEVLLHLYRRRGDAMLDAIEGMYALAVWDRAAARLLLARDPTGIKPLFLRRDPDRIAFASEPKALLADPRVSREPDPVAIATYVQQLWVSGSRSAFAAIEQLPPGHKLVVDAAGEQLEAFFRYRTMPPHRFAGPGEAADRLEPLLRRVVREQMVADVPVGVMLSAGIDSGLVAALMTEGRRAAGIAEPLTAFTAVYGPEGERYDEGDGAAGTARHLGLRQCPVPIDAADLHDAARRMVERFDAPHAVPTALVHDAVCATAASEVKVLLAGDGGDEAFGGYPRYRALALLALYRRAPRALREGPVARLAARLVGLLPERPDGSPLLGRVRRFAEGGAGDFDRIWRRWHARISDAELAELLHPDLRGAVAHARHRAGGSEPGHPGDLPARAALHDARHFLPGNVLTTADRVSMGRGLEVRVPLAERRILDFGLRLPASLRLPPGAFADPAERLLPGKPVLRELARRHLPRAAVARPKQGFVPPLGSWLNGPLRPALRRALDPATLDRHGMIDAVFAARLLDEHRRGRRDRTGVLWALVMLDEFMRSRVERFDPPGGDAAGPPLEVLPPLARTGVTPA